MNEAPAGLIHRFGAAVEELVDDKIEEHVEQYHVPPKDYSPITALPFSNRIVTDVDCARAHELMDTGYTEGEAARSLGIPLMRLQLALAHYESRFQRLVGHRRLP